jgi:hypothetical protein
MVRLDTLVVTSLKPSGQRRSFQFRTYFFCVILGTLVASATISFANETSPRSSARFITTAHQVRYLTIEQAKQGRAVHLTGVITYYDPEEPDLFIQDASGGIWAKPNEPLSAGDLVEIDGVTEAPDFAPQVGRPCFQSDWTSSVTACPSRFLCRNVLHPGRQPARRGGGRRP